MSSLRARILASLLVLAGAGLLALAAVTYTEQRSFLEGRLNQQVHFAVPLIHGTLSRSGQGPLGEHFGVPGHPPRAGAPAAAPAAAAAEPSAPVISPGAGGAADRAAPTRAVLVPTCSPAPTASCATPPARCSGTCSSPSGSAPRLPPSSRPRSRWARSSTSARSAPPGRSTACWPAATPRPAS